MNSTPRERLYALLPELYRRRDNPRGEPLRAFLSVLEHELNTLQADMVAQADNWFIQTCDDWAINYIAALLDVRQNPTLVAQLPFTNRRYVANTLAYRRRKGTLVVLEQVAWDLTNWHVHAVEFSKHLVATQHIEHVRNDGGGTIAISQAESASGADDPFSAAPHTATISHPPQGRYNPETIGLYFWRLKSYPVKNSPARSVDGTSRCFTFSRNGDIPVFSDPQPFNSITQTSTRVNVPFALTRTLFAADLAAYHAQNMTSPSASFDTTSAPSNSQYYGPKRGLHVQLDGVSVPPSEVVSMSLEPWPVPDKTLDAVAAARDTTPCPRIAIDVERGRLALLETPKTSCPHVVADYTYGFSSEIGGGPYPRDDQVVLDDRILFEIHVASGAQPSTRDVNNLKSTLAQAARSIARNEELSDDLRTELSNVLIVDSLEVALDCWERFQAPRAKGIIRILDNDVYPLHSIKIGAGCALTIIADDGVQPTLIADKQSCIQIHLAEASPQFIYPKQDELKPASDRVLRLSGLRVEQPLCLAILSDIQTLQFAMSVEHCTLQPAAAAIFTAAATALPATAAIDSSWLQLTIAHTISGAIDVGVGQSAVTITDSIVDSGTLSPAIRAEQLTVARSTVFGEVRMGNTGRAIDTIFTGPVSVDNKVYSNARSGDAVKGDTILQNSYTPNASAGEDTVAGEDAVNLVFTSRCYGDPGYAQLGAATSARITHGATNGAELGVFSHLCQPQRVENLNLLMDEYMPYGFRLGIFYVT